MKVLDLDKLFINGVMDGVDASGQLPDGLRFVIQIDDDAKHRIVADLGFPGEVSVFEESAAEDGEWWLETDGSVPISDAAVLALADLILRMGPR